MGMDYEARQYLDSLDDRQLGCLAGGHDWPLDHLRIGKPVPRGLRALPAEGSGSRIVEECRNRCGTERTVSRAGDGTLSRFAYRRLPQRPGEEPIWKVRSGIELTRRDFRAEIITMTMGALVGGTQ